MWSSESVERDAAQPIFSLCASCVVGFRRPQLDMDDGEDGGYEDDAATEYDNDEGGEESAAADQRAHNPAYEAAVEQLNEAEEQLLAAHIGAVRRTSSARAFALDGGNSLTLLFCVVLFGCVFFFSLGCNCALLSATARRVSNAHRCFPWWVPLMPLIRWSATRPCAWRKARFSPPSWTRAWSTTTSTSTLTSSRCGLLPFPSSSAYSVILPGLSAWLHYFEELVQKSLSPLLCHAPATSLKVRLISRSFGGRAYPASPPGHPAAAAVDYERAPAAPGGLPQQEPRGGPGQPTHLVGPGVGQAHQRHELRTLNAPGFTQTGAARRATGISKQADINNSKQGPRYDCSNSHRV